MSASRAGRPLIVGVGALRTDDAQHLARDAAQADALLLAPVSYTPLTQKEAREQRNADGGMDQRLQGVELLLRLGEFAGALVAQAMLEVLAAAELSASASVADVTRFQPARPPEM